ncbi:hypothetical protein DFQ10_1271 [Winogradskyella eximia]|uniref:Uncharacterized protein n=1 Tax=Winogradskyella eximia TaxID=262006 RepID=A0A3D9GPG8_9FLAO|nr:hypothetical protein [Winogradskyella eximia]RED37663.1 hypothetical protein DFQ10_1271 [Winogradskyella eximia]
MGTHIDCIIPKEKEYSVEEIKQKLKSTFDRLKSELLHLEEYGTFTENVNGNWWISHIPSENGNPEYITGEGDSFSIDIYKKVIHIGCIERFSSLYLFDKNISTELFKILTELSNEFRTSEKILIGAGGFGETDHIIDMAYIENADFEQVCKKMTKLNGIPAQNLAELNEKSWYLKE